MTEPRDLPDLACERLGGRVLFANDEFFAAKENLLRAEPALFVPGLYTERGKWMDGWESRRRRTPGHDWCVVQLGTAAVLRAAVVDTAHFKGNHPESCSLEGCHVEGDPSLERFQNGSIEWTELLPRTPLRGDSRNEFALSSPWSFTHVRLAIHPDGGVARLRLHGEALPRWSELARGAATVEIACSDRGGRVVDASDMFFASPHNLILPGSSRAMSDGWETRRRRGGGHDWSIVRLAARGTIRRVEIDTSHFKGNAPGSASIDVLRSTQTGSALSASAAPAGDAPRGERDVERSALSGQPWRPLLAQIPLAPDSVHTFERELGDVGPVSHLRLNIFPDGGVARLRVFAELDGSEVEASNLRWLNTLPSAAAREVLRACCGSASFAEKMAAARPFASRAAATGLAERVWRSLETRDHLEAFAAHPKLGERVARPTAVGSTDQRFAHFSSGEQSALRANADAAGELARVNRDYEARFGFVFLLCASGRSATDVLETARLRLGNTRDTELANAAGEQEKITRLRLERLLAP